jgi:holo-[acyl-carrier protein] synthase
MSMIGIDMVSIKRIADIKYKEMFVKRVLTISEQARFYSFTSLARQHEWLAGRFALKESIIKVIDEFIAMSDIDIKVTHKKLSFLYQNQVIHLSVSHDEQYAIAIAQRIE